MTDPPYLLDLPRANVVLAAIQEVCRFRKWDLIAAHVRSNHVHLIVDGCRNPIAQLCNSGVFRKSIKRRTQSLGARRQYSRTSGRKSHFAGNPIR
jgi:REP element-mobilizing transposase RayT